MLFLGMVGYQPDADVKGWSSDFGLICLCAEF